MRAMGLRQRQLLRLLLVFSLAGALTLFSAEGCPAAASTLAPGPAWTSVDRLAEPIHQAGSDDTPPGTDLGSCMDDWDFVPNGPYPTFTEKPFWIVLGLVVLGWLVLAADAPRDGL